MNPIPPARLCHFERATVRAYLDELAALAVRYGIVVESGYLAPRSADTDGYLLSARGYVRTYAAGSHESFVAEGLRGSKRFRSWVMAASISSITAHELIRQRRR
jgi:hypothetical protein